MNQSRVDKSKSVYPVTSHFTELIEVNMKSKRSAAICSGLVFSMAAALPSLASATVIYEFAATSAVSGLPYGSFTYIAPTFISGIVNVPEIELAGCSVTFPTSGASCGTQLFDSLTYAAQSKVQVGFGTNLASTVYLFDADAFTALGTHTSLDPGYNQFASMTVSVSPVPEASVWSTLLVGLLVVSRVKRDRQTLL